MMDFETAIGVALFFGVSIAGLVYAVWHIGRDLIREAVRHVGKVRQFGLRFLFWTVLLFAATFGLARLPQAAHIFGNWLVAVLFVFPALALAFWFLAMAVQASLEASSRKRTAAALKRPGGSGPWRLVDHADDVDWYQFELNSRDLSIFNQTDTVELMFDIDFADGLGQRLGQRRLWLGPAPSLFRSGQLQVVHKARSLLHADRLRGRRCSG